MAIEFPPPSQVLTGREDATPFIGCFGRFEAELCAALYVEACAELGDRWQPIGPQEIWGAFRRLSFLEPKPPSWIGFAQAFGLAPDVHTLIKDGYFTKGPEHGPIEPTEAFFARLLEKGRVRS